jgi:hypothetical protein
MQVKYTLRQTLRNVIVLRNYQVILISPYIYLYEGGGSPLITPYPCARPAALGG